jgi:hypothetical protein
MWRRAVWYKFTGVSEEFTVSILMLINLEDSGFSYTSINFYHTARCLIPEDSNELGEMLAR